MKYPRKSQRFCENLIKIGQKQQKFSLSEHKMQLFRKKVAKKFVSSKNISTFALAIAQMAESVDALVSNTSGATHPGSIPGLGTRSCKFLLAALFFAR